MRDHEAQADAAGEETPELREGRPQHLRRIRGIAQKAIARRKAKANCAFRHEESRALQSALGGDDDVFVARIRRKSWKKLPDAPLGVYVAARLGRRMDDGMNTADQVSDLVTAGLKRAKLRRFMLKGPLQRRMPPTPAMENHDGDA